MTGSRGELRLVSSGIQICSESVCFSFSAPFRRHLIEHLRMAHRAGRKTKIFPWVHFLSARPHPLSIPTMGCGISCHGDSGTRLVTAPYYLWRGCSPRRMDGVDRPVEAWGFGLGEQRKGGCVMICILHIQLTCSLSVKPDMLRCLFRPSGRVLVVGGFAL